MDCCYSSLAFTNVRHRNLQNLTVTSLIGGDLPWSKSVLQNPVNQIVAKSVSGTGE